MRTLVYLLLTASALAVAAPQPGEAAARRPHKAASAQKADTQKCHVCVSTGRCER